ncbi:MAG: hypothetical protein QXG98_01825 [Candidatus Micrarchaeia archaeon]
MSVCADLANWPSAWYTVAAIGIVASGAVIGLVYMIGVTLGNPGLTARAKNEIYQVVATLCMLALAVGFVGFACTADLSGFGVSGTIYSAAEAYLSWLASRSMYVLERMMHLAGTWGFLGSIGMGITISGIGFSFNPFSGLFGLVNILNIFMSTALILSLTTAAQYVVFKFALEGFLGYLLPVGLVCRCFPFTRDFGGALIALSVGFSLFYPFLFAVDWALVGQPTKSTIGGGGGDFDRWAVVDTLVGWYVSFVVETVGIVTFFAVVGVPLIIPPIPIVSILKMLMEISIMFLDSMMQSALMPIGEILVGGLFLPALNGIILVAVVRDLSRVLGEEVDITTLTRMV